MPRKKEVTIKEVIIEDKPKREKRKKSVLLPSILNQKKVVRKKRRTTRKRTPKITFKDSSELKVEKTLIQNFVSLQKVMTNISIRFDHLSDQIQKLLDLFEISAKSIADKSLNEVNKTSNKEVLEKLEKVLEQNKILAQGVSMLHEKEEAAPQPISPPQQFKQIPPPQGYGKPLVREQGRPRVSPRY